MTLCPSCDTEYKAWQSAPVLTSEQRVYSRADNAHDMYRLNYDRYRARISAQLRLIRAHCTNHHQEIP